MKLPDQDDPDYIRPKPHDDEVESFAVRLVSSAQDDTLN
jgi:hypothetical protein